jgi:hypothetical protein
MEAPTMAGEPSPVTNDLKPMIAAVKKEIPDTIRKAVPDRNRLCIQVSLGGLVFSVRITSAAAP